MDFYFIVTERPLSPYFPFMSACAMNASQSQTSDVPWWSCGRRLTLYFCFFVLFMLLLTIQTTIYSKERNTVIHNSVTRDHVIWQSQLTNPVPGWSKRVGRKR